MLLSASVGNAAPPSLSYQGRIVKSDGKPLEYSNVAFAFQITSPNGLCILYEEQLSNIDMQNSGGVFDTPIGTGSRSFPTSGTSTVLDVFNNSAPSLPCKGGSTYVPALTDVRKLRVQFHDGSGWQLISPDNTIRSVPYAGYSYQATRLQDHEPQDFILKTGVPSCAANTFLSWNGTALSCEPVSGSAGGTVTNVTAGTGLITSPGGGIVATGSIGIAPGGVGTTEIANGSVTSAKMDTLPGLTASTYGSASSIPIITVDGKGRITAISTNAITTPSIQFSDIKNSMGGSAFDVGACNTNQTVAWSALTDTFTCQNIAGLDASVLTSGTIATARLPTTLTDALWETSGGNVYRSTGSVGVGVTSPLVAMDVRGNRAKALSSIFTAYSQVGSNDAAPLRLIFGYKAHSTASNRYAGIQVEDDGVVRSLNLQPWGGNVSIGGSSATEKFEVWGEGNPLGVLLRSGLASSSTRIDMGRLTANDAIIGISASNDGFVTGSVAGDLVLKTQAARKILFDTNNGSGTPVMVLAANNGNVGIGSTTPTEKLDVSGKVKATEFCIGTSCLSSWPSAGGSGTVTNITAGTGLAGGSISTSGTISIAPGGVGTTEIADTSVTSAKLATSLTDAFWDTSSGNVYRSTGSVGIGTATPNDKLDVAGKIRATHICATDGTNCKDLSTSWNSGTGDFNANGSVAMTGVFRAAAGNNTTPSITFDADTGTGFYSVATNTIGFISNSIERYRFGSASIASQINYAAHVSMAGISANNPTFTFTNDTDTGMYHSALDTVALSAGGVRGFEVKTAASAVNYVAVTPAAAAAGPVISAAGSDTNIDLTLAPKGSGNTIFSSGKVGIGTTSPSRNLEISAADSNTAIRVVNTTSSATRGPNISIRNYVNGNNGAPYLELMSSGGTQASPSAVVSNQTLGTVGFVGGYDTAGGYNNGASIVGAADGNFSATSTPGRIIFQTVASGSISPTERMRITSDGNVGIGSTPTYKLDVNGDVSIAAASALRFGATSVCTSAGCTSASDRSLKENIYPLQNSLAKVLQLRGVEYNYKDLEKFTSKKQIGVIAQEVEEVFPEVVSKDPHTGLRAVAYDHLVAPLIESVKEIYSLLVLTDERILKLENENAELKARLERLEKKLEGSFPAK